MDSRATRRIVTPHWGFYHLRGGFENQKDYLTNRKASRITDTYTEHALRTGACRVLIPMLGGSPGSTQTSRMKPVSLGTRQPIWEHRRSPRQAAGTKTERSTARVCVCVWDCEVRRMINLAKALWLFHPSWCSWLMLLCSNLSESLPPERTIMRPRHINCTRYSGRGNYIDI